MQHQGTSHVPFLFRQYAVMTLSCLLTSKKLKLKKNEPRTLWLKCEHQKDKKNVGNAFLKMKAEPKKFYRILYSNDF